MSNSPSSTIIGKNSRAKASFLIVLTIVDVVTVLGLLIAILWLIWRCTPQVPFADEWATTNLFRRWDNGTLSLRTFWEQHNVHRILIPRVVDFILIWLTGYNRQIEMTFDLGVGVASAALFAGCARRTFGGSVAVAAWTPAIACLMLSPAQYENWLAPFQITFIATIFGVALSAWALYVLPARPRSFILALIGAVIAALSSFAGLAALFAFLPYLWFSPYRQPRYLGAWLFVAFGLTTLYLYGLKFLNLATSNSVDYVKFFFTCLGAPIATNGFFAVPLATTSALLFGVASLALICMNSVILILLKERSRDLALWISVAMFAGASAAFISMGRNYWIGAGMTPRYQAFTVLWWLATFVLMVLTISRLRARLAVSATCLQRFAFAALAMINIAMIGISGASLVRADLTGFREGQRWHQGLQHDQDCVRYYSIASNECLQEYFRDVDILRDSASVLASHHFGIFRELPPSANALPRGREALVNLERVGAVVVTAYRTQAVSQLQGTPLSVSGWAIDPAIASVPKLVFITVDGKDYMLADYGQDRPDVASAYKRPEYRYSGFRAQLDTARLTAGWHRLGIRMQLTNPESSYTWSHHVNLKIGQFSSLSSLVSNQTHPVFNIDFINGKWIPAFPEQVTLAPGQPLQLSGWAVDDLRKRPAGGIKVVVDDKMEIQVPYGGNRADVARFKGMPNYLYVGFTVVIPAADIPPGVHTVTVVVLAGDLQSYYLPARYTVSIKAF